MPPQSGRSPVSALSTAIVAAKDNEVEYGMEFIDLPGGIRNGIARLIEAKIGVYQKGENQGQKFLYLAGEVCEPTETLEVIKAWEAGSGGDMKKGHLKVMASRMVSIRGQRTNQTLPLCETSYGQGDKKEVTTLKENVDIAINHLLMLTGPGALASVNSDADLENVFLPDLKKVGPYFKFSTSQRDPTAQYPNPRVWQNWYGNKDVPEGYQPPVEGLTNDASGATPPTPATNGVPQAVPVPTKPTAAPAAQEDQSDDLDMLAMVASGEEGPDCDAAIKKLVELAHSVGITDEAIESEYGSWEDIKNAIVEKQASETPPAEEEELPVEEEGWKVGDACLYQPNDPKTKKPALNKQKKPLLVKCTITAIKEDSCELLASDKKTKYKPKLDKLQPA